MISVTIAAQGKSKRVVGGHLKAYGSGRLSFFDLNKNEKKKKKSPSDFNIWWRLAQKLVEMVLEVLYVCFPFMRTLMFEGSRKSASTETEEGEEKGSKGMVSCLEGKREAASGLETLSDATLLRILRCLDVRSIVAAQRVCTRWRSLIEQRRSELAKAQKDQIRLLFDEGEILIYPTDERKCPARHAMPSLQTMSARLRHLRCLSLFVRGLIPIECSPVLSSLCSLSLAPQQIYFIWCKFSPDSSSQLEEFVHANAATVVDFGVEECTPCASITDSLIAPLLPALSSLRVWNDGRSGTFAITDTSILHIADLIRSASVRVETLDVASCTVTATAVVALIEAWHVASPSDLSLSFSHCSSITYPSLVAFLRAKGILVEDGKIMRNGRCLTLYA